MYEEDKVELEGEWGFTRLGTCAWMAPNVWASKTRRYGSLKMRRVHVLHIDYKTGNGW